MIIYLTLKNIHTMGFFDFLKPKRNEALDAAQAMLKQVFPNGDLDYQAGTAEVLNILNNAVSKEVARNIFTKSTLICRIVSMKEGEDNKFDVERLKVHLSGYCIQYFNEDQIKRLHNYQVALLASSFFGKTAKDINRLGDGYSW